MTCIRVCSVAALMIVGRPAAAQSITFPVWCLTPYPSLHGGSLAPTIGEDQFISPDGTIVFKAFLSTQMVVCKVTADGPVVLARSTDPAPGSPGQTFGQFDYLRPSPGGAGFRAVLVPGTSTSGAYLVDDQGTRPFLIVGQPAPGAPGLNITYIGDITVNHGRAVIPAGLPGTTQGEALWAGPPGDVQLLARRNIQAVGMAPGRVYAGLSSTPAINAAGEIAFSAEVGPSPHTDGIWRGTPGNLTLAQQTGEAAPGLPDFTFCHLWNPVLNATGDMAFHASICSSTTELVSIWHSSNGIVAPIAIQGESAPGTSAQFSTFPPLFGTPPTLVLSNPGLVVFKATLTGPGVTSANNTGIWAGRPGNVHLIARIGDQAAGSHRPALPVARRVRRGPGVRRRSDGPNRVPRVDQRRHRVCAVHVG